MNASVMVTRLLRSTCALLLLGSCGGAAVAPYNTAFSRPAIRADIVTLAQDSTRGRLVGTPELEKVGDWLSDRFAKLGLAPAGKNGTYDQPFEMLWFTLAEGNRLSIKGAGAALSPGAGWFPANVSGSASAAGEAVFAGFGIVEPRLGWDDYRGSDVSGKVVLVLEREPGVADPLSPFDGLVTAQNSREWRKALAAQQHGAAAILFVRDVHNRPDVCPRDAQECWAAASADYWPVVRRRTERSLLRAWVDVLTIPAAFISAPLAEALVAGSGRTLQELARAAEAASGGLGVIALPGSRVELSTAVQRHVMPARNILAKVEGADPKRRDEAVVMLAHYDHAGAANDTLFNGADDNASGVAGLLALAEAYAKASADGQPPKRSVIFAALDAEERGLLGAWHLALDPPVPLERIAAVLNIDMIGRNEEVPANGGPRFNGLEPQSAESNTNTLDILGYSRAPTLAAAVQKANRETGLTLHFRYDNNDSNLLRRSDHWPFLQNDVPALFFLTGLHPEYHTAADDEERINYEKMLRIVRLIHQLSWDVANGEERFPLTPMGPRPKSD